MVVIYFGDIFCACMCILYVISTAIRDQSLWSGSRYTVVSFCTAQFYTTTKSFVYSSTFVNCR